MAGIEEEPQVGQPETDKDLEVKRLRAEVDQLKASMIELLNGLQIFAHSFSDSSVSGKLYEAIDKASEGIATKSDLSNITEDFKPVVDSAPQTGEQLLTQAPVEAK